MVYRKWQLPQADTQQVRALSQDLGVSTMLGEVLYTRGFKNAAQAMNWLGEGEPLSDPMRMQDMEKLVERVHRAVDHGEKIVIYGDYDVDGVTATALMLSYLESIGANVFYKLPNREGDGYGLTKEAIDLLVRKKVHLLLTVDNGISAVEEADYAAKAGLDLLVTDHHLPPSVLPKALAVVDPLREDDDSPAKNLSGVGVAFKVICALEGCAPEELLPFYGDFVAVGTVADMMSLTGENRKLVREGIACLQSTQHCGLQAMIRGCGLEDKPLTAENISFGIAPRLNAAGRMEDASVALQLLITEDEEEAEELVEQLNAYNVQRQEIEQGIAEELVQRISSDFTAMHRPVLIAWGKGYHQGVIGIVASRLVERFGKPAIVFTVDENGMAKGSGRSFEGFSLYSAIASCQELLERFGGHDLAAGLSIREELLPEFAKRINEYAAGCRIEHPPLTADGFFHLTQVRVEDVEQLALLAPFGNGNPSPLFVLEKARIEGVYPVSEGRHVRLRFSQEGASFQAVLFGVSPTELAYKTGDTVDVLLSLSIYHAGTQTSVSGRIKALRPSNLGEAYLEEWMLYNRFQSGSALTTEEKSLLRPTREDVVRVYREVGTGGITQNDLRPLFARCAGQHAGRLLVALDVLCELNHVTATGKGALTQTGGQKRALSESTLLKNLEE